MRTYRSAVLVTVALALTSGLLVAPKAAPAPPSVDDVIAGMTLKEKVGQLVMFSPNGVSLSADEKRLIEEHHLGGIIIFSKNYDDRAQLTVLTAQIQKAARAGSEFKVGALISADQEGGVVKRFKDMPPNYSAPEMGDIGKVSVARAQGSMTAKALKSVGVNIDLAPVADLDIGPAHVMKQRSFGSSKYDVGRLAQAFARGLQGRGVAAAVKHFPGFGGASMNSDDGRAYVRRSRWQLHKVDGRPFHKVIDANVKLVMVSHAMYVNDGGNVPASVNRRITKKRLRNEFGFEGVAISDDLLALSWRYGGSVSSTCVASVRAGMDIALLAGEIGTAIACAQGITQAVRNGTISKFRVDQAVRRVLELKVWVGVF